MKKWIFSVVAIVALSSVATFVTQNFRPEEITLAQLANIEALANDDDAPADKKLKCYNTITSDDSSKVRYCPICDFIPGDDTWNAPASTCTK